MSGSSHINQKALAGILGNVTADLALKFEPIC